MRRPAPVYKVYIIDEVHMLSKQAFNGLLKTLEEPPPHVKFVFATTEIRKVPVTVLSRCQRFDLRRIETPELVAHLRAIADKENVAIEDGALALIARAAEGSARDALSLLDQAMAHGEGGTIGAETMRAMLGLADRGRILDLFEKLNGGQVAEALSDLSELYDRGADPLAVIQDLLETTHFLTRTKVAPGAEGFFDGGSAEAARAGAMAGKLSVPSLTRAWQLLLKGLFEVRDATRPMAALEMALIRLAYAADLPPTDKLVRDVLDGNAPPAPPRAPAPSANAGGTVRAQSTGSAQAAAAPQFDAAPCADAAHAGRHRRAGRRQRRAGAEGAHRKRHASGAAGAGPAGIPPQRSRAAYSGGRSCPAPQGLDRHALGGDGGARRRRPDYRRAEAD